MTVKRRASGRSVLGLGGVLALVVVGRLESLRRAARALDVGLEGGAEAAKVVRRQALNVQRARGGDDAEGHGEVLGLARPPQHLGARVPRRERVGLHRVAHLGHVAEHEEARAGVGRPLLRGGARAVASAPAAAAPRREAAHLGAAAAHHLPKPPRALGRGGVRLPRDAREVHVAPQQPPPRRPAAAVLHHGDAAGEAVEEHVARVHLGERGVAPR
eukprot:CAMPEP_0198436502 /NCGR_PEP_ID=MMETSP1452-20131203/42817_1 /TAXON_ID=1181717 /ORGANISM="Synchroma pusillum, Strain CCMP3072" /LENGTH=215 /DNA_ID=CAMNT_0044157055 /DNA_START=11 /DNA_END=654 /DNA_ORIENTATION=-